MSEALRRGERHAAEPGEGGAPLLGLLHRRRLGPLDDRLALLDVAAAAHEERTGRLVVVREAAREAAVDARGGLVLLLLLVVVGGEADGGVAHEVRLRVHVGHLHVLLAGELVLLEHLQAVGLVVLRARRVVALGPDREDGREARQRLGVEETRLLLGLLGRLRLPFLAQALRLHLLLGRQLLVEVGEQELALRHVGALGVVLQRLLEDLAVVLRLLEEALGEPELHQHRGVDVAEALGEEADRAVRALVDRARRRERARVGAGQHPLVAVGHRQLLAELHRDAVVGKEHLHRLLRARRHLGDRLAGHEDRRPHRAGEDAGVRQGLGEHHLADGAAGGGDVHLHVVGLLADVAVGVVDAQVELLADVRGGALGRPRGVDERERGG